MAAPVRTLCSSVLRLSRRQFSTTCGVQGGEKWRKENGISKICLIGRSQTADQKQEREALARRIVMLSSEVDKGIETWNDKQEEAQRMEEHNKSLLLKPKGMMLIKNKSNS
ncbi:39S ribosomal protein L52 mitochondrial [Dissostichus eleginoides]|uniref:Large ribosomal subunit protein mL52 n=1 Tax=Dissostichus eleginoides TaxID=100907 RepID=A0AAD9BWK9_DISEL|nr:39S ribosomal protein L52 mitochondrial [Dissostichus eleginoides]